MTATQTITREIEFTASIDAKETRADYGVPGSPVWTEYDPYGWSDYTVDIAGVTVKLSELPETLRNALWDVAVDALDDNGWESYDE